MAQDKPTVLSKGLHLDNSPIIQPQETYRFALNAVNETELGDFMFIGNEESNSPFASIKEGFVLIGKVYLGENEVCLFSVSKDDMISEIGILKNNGEYIVHVNDSTSSAGNKLNFKVSKQIQAIYRLRRGCEKTIYFTDNYNKPRYFNFNKAEEFQDAGEWVARKFALVRNYTKVPEFQSIKVLDSGGELFPGSYNVAVQYVDLGLNPTEWITSSEILYVYNSKLTQDFLDIHGSIHSVSDFENFPVTSKSIRVDMDNLDLDFPFYRLAFIEASTGTGVINEVKITNVIPTSKKYFIYSGTNVVSTGTTEEIAFFNSVIHTAGSIEQLENRLLLANTKGPQIQFCKLQKYASRIKADVVLHKVILNDVNDISNPKNPSHRMHSTGYMPGEIYSFGLVYVFEDGTISPTYHIPGKSSLVPNNLIYTDPVTSYPMSNIENTSTSDTYIDIGTCPNSDYWGLDSEGSPLKDTPVRHHRFPKRSDLGLDLVTIESSTATPFLYYRLSIHMSSPLTGATGSFPINISYTVDGETQVFTKTINPSLYRSDPAITTALSPPAEDTFLGPYHTSNAIVVTKIEELQPGGTVIDLIANPGTSTIGSVYTASVISSTSSAEDTIFSTQIMGVKFSGVDYPSIEDTAGLACIGYYIVRSERTDSEKTIIDSAVIIPNLINSNYSAHGLLNPDVDPSKIDKRVYGFITPEHKFNNKEFTDFDNIEQEGYFGANSPVGKVYSKTRYNDVMDGTSYTDDFKDGNDDGPDSNNGKGADGWSLGIILRDTFTKFFKEKVFNITKDKIKEIFYLKALENRDINNGLNTVYNIAADNRIGILHLNEDNLINVGKDKLPYVLLKRNLIDYYSNYRTLPYYKDSINMATSSETEVFGGDAYVAPIRYTNTVFWDNRLARKAGRTSAWKYIAGAVLVVVGAILTIVSWGTLTAATALVIGAGISLIGGGALMIASGVSRDAYNKAYAEEWGKGLRETSLDNWVDKYYKQNTSDFGTTGNSNTSDGPSDDEIQWTTDSLTDLWFETQVNTNLRTNMTSDVPTYLDAPGKRETGNREPLNGWKYFGIHFENSVSRYPVSKLDVYANRKLAVFDSTRKDNRLYLGIPLGVHYKLNPDYLRLNKQKTYFHLPLEYDCCSDCIETFPHRIHYSEQSFQEELIDNYRVFLPNNYRDIDGETGPISNVFKINNNLFLHTNEALWQMPKNYQERVTDQIVSFIGTGSYFEIPPQKILDDDTGSSAGLQHKWSGLKTPQGYLFVSENQKKIYLFNGANLKVLSDLGLSNYFKENVGILTNEQYYKSTGERYKYDDNPSNPLGTGFITAYDTKKERYLVTKKDFSLNSLISDGSDFDIDVNTGIMTYFPDIDETIEEQEALGYNYIGIENSQLKFEKLTTETVIEERSISTTITVPNEAHVYAFLDTSGSFSTGTYLADLETSIRTWYAGFRPEDIGATKLHVLSNGTEQWINFPATIVADTSTHGGKVLVISLVNEASPVYHTGSLAGTINPTATYITDYNNFVNVVYPQFSFFKGITYPIATTGASYGNSNDYIRHTLLALKGTSYSIVEADAIPVNSSFTTGEWNSVKAQLTGTNPYQPLGLGADQYGWSTKTDRNDYSVIAGTQSAIITPEQFSDDINALLEGSTTTVIEPVETDVEKVIVEYKYIPGIPVTNPVEFNNSWTMSFSLKANSWISWHSYLPSMYITTPENLHSYIPNNSIIWKHNVKGNYQTFYEVHHPHIIEYVASNNPIETKVTDSIKLLTEAKTFDITTKEYVEQRYITFNKAVLYNSRQCTGLLTLVPKDTQANPQDYLANQIVNLNDNTVIIDRNERDWAMNDIRDIRIDYTKSIWNSDKLALQSNYFIDKVLNVSTLDPLKDWTQLESFRDKFLFVRLIFDNFANTKLITNFSIENEQQSFT